jgi:hypothetical protein
MLFTGMVRYRIRTLRGRLRPVSFGAISVTGEWIISTTSRW